MHLRESHQREMSQHSLNVFGCSGKMILNLTNLIDTIGENCSLCSIGCHYLNVLREAAC